MLTHGFYFITVPPGENIIADGGVRVTRFGRVCLCLLGLFAALLSAETGRADMDSPVAAEVAPGMELVAGTGLSRLWLPSYSGADTVYDPGGGGRSNGRTLTDFSGSIDCNSFSLGLNVDIPWSLPGFPGIRLVSQAQYAEGEYRTSEKQTTGDFILGLSVDPRYVWVGAVGSAVAGTTYAESVRINAQNVDFSLGFEGKGAARALSDAVSVTPLAYAGLLVQHQRMQYQTFIERLDGSGQYDSLDERVHTTMGGPELRAGVEFALPWDVNVQFMTNAAWLIGACSLSADQDMYFTTAFVATNRSPTPHVSRDRNDTYDTFTYGASVKAEKPIFDALRLRLEFFATQWTSLPGIENPTYISMSPAIPAAAGTNPGVRIRYDEAGELGLKMGLTYTF